MGSDVVNGRSGALLMAAAKKIHGELTNITRQQFDRELVKVMTNTSPEDYRKITAGMDARERATLALKYISGKILEATHRETARSDNRKRGK